MRKIDNKFGIEGERIINTASGEEIPEDEPLFLLRARDLFALYILQEYYKMCKDIRCTSIHLVGIGLAITEFELFRQQYPDRMKQPGITEGRKVGWMGNVNGPGCDPEVGEKL